MASKTTVLVPRSPLTKTPWCRIMLSQRSTLVIITSRFTRSSLGINMGWISKLNNSKPLITNWNKISSRNNRRWKVITSSMTSSSSRWISRMRELVAAQSWAPKLNWRINKFGAFQICSIWCSNLIISWARKSSSNAELHSKLLSKTLTLMINTTIPFQGSQCSAAAKLTSINTDIHKVDQDFKIIGDI